MTVTTAQSRIAAKTTNKDPKQGQLSLMPPVSSRSPATPLSPLEEEFDARDSLSGLIASRLTKSCENNENGDKVGSGIRSGLDEYTETLHAEQDRERRLAMSAQDYLDRYGVQHYLSDVIMLLLDSWTESPLDLIAR
jgi:hypothetical protein